MARLIDRIFSKFEFNEAILIEDTFNHLGTKKPRN
jgi:hypothetical protein